MPGKSGIVRPVDAGRAAGRDKNGLRIDFIRDRLIDTEPHSASDFSSGRNELTVCLLIDCISRNGQIIGDVHMVENRDILLRGCGLREERLDVLSVDLDVPPAAGDVLPILILQNDEPEVLHDLSHMVEPLGHREEQVPAHNAGRVMPRIIDIILRDMSLCDVGVDGIYAGRQTSRAPDVRLLRDRHADVRSLPEDHRGKAACGASADNQDICVNSFSFHRSSLSCQTGATSWGLPVTMIVCIITHLFILSIPNSWELKNFSSYNLPKLVSFLAFRRGSAYTFLIQYPSDS